MIAEAGHVTATVELSKAAAPKELQVKFRLPKQNVLKNLTVNGMPGQMGGPQRDSVIIPTGNQTRFQIVGEYA